MPTIVRVHSKRSCAFQIDMKGQKWSIVVPKLMATASPDGLGWFVVEDFDTNTLTGIIKHIDLSTVLKLSSAHARGSWWK
jgi:hypothetical protein